MTAKRTLLPALDDDFDTIPPNPVRTVLVAEDDGDMRKLVCGALTDAGYAVRSANDGHGMLALLTGASRGEVPFPDAIVMDVRMPRCSGVDILRALRLAEWEVPVIFVTAFPDADVLASAAELRASCTLEKPVDLDDIVTAVDLVIHGPSRSMPG